MAATGRKAARKTPRGSSKAGQTSAWAAIRQYPLYYPCLGVVPFLRQRAPGPRPREATGSTLRSRHEVWIRLSALR
jgi:hypothetical protein